MRKHDRAILSPMNHVMREVGKNEARVTGHGGILNDPENKSVPFFLRLIVLHGTIHHRVMINNREP